MNKAELLAVLRADRAALEAALGAIGEARMAIPGESGAYSAKDIVGHLAAYERALVIWLNEARAGRAFVDPVLDQPDLAARNAVVFAANQNRSAQALLAAFWSARYALEAAIAALDDAWLEDPAATAWFVAPRWGNPKPLWACLLNDSVEHARQHLPDLARLAAADGTSSSSRP